MTDRPPGLQLLEPLLVIGFGPSGGKGGATGGFSPVVYLTADLPILLLGVGVIGVVVGVAGVWRSRPTTSPKGGRLADLAARVGLVVAVAAVLTLVANLSAPSIVEMASRPAPCTGFDTACFATHPDYYQPIDHEGWSTPSSRVSESVGPLFLAAWLAALAGALVSMLALVMRTAHRRTAMVGLLLGSLVTVGMTLLTLVVMFTVGG